MKKNDYILITVILLLCAILFAVFKLTRNKGSVVNISSDGETIGNYPLNEDNEIYVTYKSSGYNTVIIRNGAVEISTADCPDLICTKHRPITASGETIVCLPHKMVVKILD